MNQMQCNDRQSVAWAGWLCIGLLAVLTAIGSGCSKKSAPAGRPPAMVTVEAAQQRDVPVYIDAFGQLVSTHSVDIVPQITGKLLEAPFKEGDIVKKGDVLLRIEDNEYKAQLEKAQAAVKGDEVNLKLKRATLDRNRKLFDNKLISQESFDGYQTDVDAAEAALAADQAALALAQINLDYCTIAAPIDGVVGKKLVDPGNIVAANSTKLVSLRSVNPIYVDFSVPEKYVDLIRSANARGVLDINFMPEHDLDPIVMEAQKSAGMSLETIRQKVMDTAYDGELTMIDNTVDNDTGTIALRARADNSGNALWPGQFVTLGLIVETVKDAIIVPSACVLYGKQGPYVYVIGADKKAQLRVLELGPEWMGYLIIETGVKAGEQVVSLGQLGLYPGADVMMVPARTTTNAASAKP